MALCLSQIMAWAQLAKGLSAGAFWWPWLKGRGQILIQKDRPLTRGTFHSIKMPTVQYLLWLDKLSTPIHCCSPSDVIIVYPFAWLESAYHHLHIHSFPKRLVLLIISPPPPFLACVLLLLFHLTVDQNSKLKTSELSSKSCLSIRITILCCFCRGLMEEKRKEKQRSMTPKLKAPIRAPVRKFSNKRLFLAIRFKLSNGWSAYSQPIFLFGYYILSI